MIRWTCRTSLANFKNVCQTPPVKYTFFHLTLLLVSGVICDPARKMAYCIHELVHFESP